MCVSCNPSISIIAPGKTGKRSQAKVNFGNPVIKNPGKASLLNSIDTWQAEFVSAFIFEDILFNI